MPGFARRAIKLRLAAISAARAAGLEKPPGFSVALRFAVFAAEVRTKSDCALSDESAGGKDVPNFIGNDIDGKIVQIFRGVGTPPSCGQGTNIRTSVPNVRGLNLDAQETSFAFQHNVVELRIAPGLGNAEAPFRGLGHKQQLDPCTALLVVCKLRLE